MSLINSPQTNGKIWRVDLTLPAAPTYEEWVAANFTNPAAPEAARTADPDGDGATNEAGIHRRIIRPTESRLCSKPYCQKLNDEC